MNGYKRTGFLSLKMEVEPQYMCPFGYGFSYWDYYRNIKICYPLGLNWIIWLLREIYFRTAHAPNGIENKSYARGYSEGFQRGMEMAIDYKNAYKNRDEEK